MENLFREKTKNNGIGVELFDTEDISEQLLKPPCNGETIGKINPEMDEIEFDF